MSHLVICAEHKKKTEKHVWLFQFSDSWQASEGAKDDLNSLEEDHLHDILPEKVTTSLVLSIPTFPFIRGLRVLTGDLGTGIWKRPRLPEHALEVFNWMYLLACIQWSCSVSSFFICPPLTAMREINLHMGQKVSCQNEKRKKTWHIRHCCDMMYSMRVPGVVICYLQGSELLLSWRKLKKISD